MPKIKRDKSPEQISSAGEIDRLRRKISKLKAEFKRLKESEAGWRLVIDEAVEGFFRSDPGGHFIWANQAMATILGYTSPEELINSPEPVALTSYVQPEKREEYKKIMNEQGQVKEFVFQARRRDGQTRWVLENARAVKDREGKILYFEGHIQDVTPFFEASQRLAETKARLETLINAIPDIIFFKNRERKYVIVNKAFEQTFRLSQEKILGKDDSQILPADLAAQCMESDAAVFNLRQLFVAEEILEGKDGQKVVLETIKAPLFEADGSLTGLVGISRDITQRKKSEEELRQLLQEKDVLLREINHRVKNNMQVISSLLSLQAQKLADDQAARALKECQERIRSMALVHDMLYQQRAFHRIEFSSYLRLLSSHLFHAYKADSSLLQLRVEAEEIYFSLNTAIPCGLIVNELITNSLQHAFLPGQRGEIIVRLERAEDKRFILSVKDNGRGLSTDFDINHPESLGLEIVKILVKQLGGSLRVTTAPGTEFQIIFEEQASSPDG
ncbi:MAG: sensor histidine kinase [Candidatus Aminicenantales bacterium]